VAEHKTVDITGVELAKVGRWHGGDSRGRAQVLDITPADLASAVAAYEHAMSVGGASAADVPIKLGHAMAQEVLGNLADAIKDGAPAYGWVGNLRLENDGRSLVGDFLRMPAKLAGMMTSGAWRRRSIEFGRDVKWPFMPDGKVFPFVMAAVAALGATAPAIVGLRDIFGASAEGDEGDEGARFFLAVNDAEEPVSEGDIERMLAKLDAVFAEFDPHFKGRAGAPMVRTLYASTKAQLLRAARFVKPTPQEGQMRAAVLAMLGQSENATNESALAAIPTAKKAALGGLYTLALNAEAGLAVLAEILGIPGATIDDVVAAVRELTGGEPVDPNAPVEDPAATPIGGGVMSNVTNDGDSAVRIAVLEREVAEAKASAAHAEVQLARNAAAAKADRDIATFSLPATIRDTLMALAARGDDDLYASVVSTTNRVPTGERGTASARDEDPIDEAAYTAALAMGLSTDAATDLFRSASKGTLNG